MSSSEQFPPLESKNHDHQHTERKAFRDVVGDRSALISNRLIRTDKLRRRSKLLVTFPIRVAFTQTLSRRLWTMRNTPE